MKNSNISRNPVSRSVRTLAIAGALAAAMAVAPAAADDEYLRDGDIPLGAADAPVTIIEYASMTCPHCATFHRETMPRLKSEYIDTGKVRLIFREFPLDSLALAASVVARCAGPEKFYGFLDVLFKQQRAWAASSDPMKALERLARFGGLKKDDFEQCMNDRDLRQKITATRFYGSKEMGVQATPTLFINGEVYPGHIPFENLDETLKAILGD